MINLRFRVDRSLFFAFETASSPTYSSFAIRNFASPCGTSGIHHLELYSIQILVNGTTIIYWNRGDGGKVTGKKDLSDGFQIVVIFWRTEVRRRPSLAALFSQTAARHRSCMFAICGRP